MNSSKKRASKTGQYFLNGPGFPNCPRSNDFVLFLCISGETSIICVLLSMSPKKMKFRTQM